MRVDEEQIIDIVIDTDAANETDDQFAVAYALMAPERVRVRSIHAAPFRHCRVNSAAEGMMNSHREIRRILSYFPNLQVPEETGSRNFLHVEAPKMSAAVGKLIAMAMQCTPERPLRVVAIAALTNIGAAIRLAPEIAPRLEVHWLGSHSYEQAPSEFNLEQDLLAALTVFGSDCRLRLYPCAGVAEKLAIFPDEVAALVDVGGALGRFLLNRYHRQHFFSFGSPLRMDRSLSLWDLAPFAGILVPEAVRMKPMARRRLLENPLRWSDPVTACEDWVCVELDPLTIYQDFRERLKRHAQKHPRLPDCLF